MSLWALAAWWREARRAKREPFDVFADTEPACEDDSIDSDFPGPTTEPSDWGALDNYPERKHP